MRLTEQSVVRLRIPTGKSELIAFDDDLPGFGVRLREGGARTWIAQFRVNGAQRRMTLGSVDRLRATEARDAARKVLAKAALGTDPQAEKAAARRRGITLQFLIEGDEQQPEGSRGGYLEFAKKNVRPRTYDEIQLHLRRHWKPLLPTSADKTTRADVSRELDRIERTCGGIAANRSRSYLSGMFSWAIAKGLAADNPVVGSLKPVSEEPRDRTLTKAELAEVWNGCRDDEYGRILRLLILTGQRREEVGGMARSELSLDQALWSIPKERTKNGRPHDVPLSTAAMQIVREQMAAFPDRELLFGAGAGGFSGWSKAKAALDRRMVAVRTEGGDQTELNPWRLHDLRRTFSTLAHGEPLSIRPHVVEAVLNHISGHKRGVAGVYNTNDYNPEKRDALDRWAAHVLTIVNAAAGRNVVPIRA